MGQALGYTSLAITDINNTSACLNFIRLAPKHGIRPIVGIDFRNGARQMYVGIAQNNIGFQALNAFLSFHSHTKSAFPETAPELEEVIFIYPFEEVLLHEKTQFRPREYIGLNLDDLKKVRFSSLYKQKERMVFMQSVTIRTKRDFNVHRLLRAIDKNTLLSKLEKKEQASTNDRMLSLESLKETLKDFPFLYRNTEKIVEECAIHFDFYENRKSQNKKRYGKSLQEDIAHIQQLCQEGLGYRYSKVTPQIEARIKKELDLIGKMDYVPFFLINWDIIKYAQHKGYYHVGRGSGANSIVAYLLGITDVDPIELDLYFERFMNLYRANPPDFDIDFSWRDRQDVTRYIFERFGQEGQVALLATYNTFQHNGAVRELGKVFGLPTHEIELLSSRKFNPKNLDEHSALVARYAQYLIGTPNHLSIHAGGILISERSIQYFSATDLPPKGFPTTQFDMVIAEDVGLYKYDILGQRGLGKIKDALTIVKQNYPERPEVDIHNVKPLLQDKKINKMVSMAECIGCFYVESPAMRMLLKKLEVKTYLELVAASSIIRPGVAKSGMMREYILRHKDPERRKQAHPVLWELMEDTYGVMVYQEDVIKVAHYFAGLSLGESDVLRRGMSGKFRSREEFLLVKTKFVENCREKGYEDELTLEVWNQVESFAGYAFAKGHSASYAVESYQSLYLKCYYPLEYMVAVLNNGGGYYRAETYIHEARMKGGSVHAPCVNRSRMETRIERKDIFLGFAFLSGLDERTIKRILEEREKNGIYSSLDDFLERVNIGVEQLDVLIRINAFRFTGVNKRKLLWDGFYKLNHRPVLSEQKSLFAARKKSLALPSLSVTELEEIFDQIELLGFPLDSPFKLLKEEPKSYLLAKEMRNNIGKTITLLGYLITTKSTSTSRKERMQFGTFIDEDGAWIDTVHFPPSVARYPFRGKGIYELVGKVVNEFDFMSLEIVKMIRLPYMEDTRFVVD